MTIFGTGYGPLVPSCATGGLNPTGAVPLYWVYITAWATQDGVAEFRDDVYARDGVGTTVMTPTPL